MPTTQQIAVGSLAVLATSALGYAAYFDYRRRNDPEFRRKLKREHKKVHVSATREARENKSKITSLLKAQLVSISKESLPSNPAEREQYFMEQVAMGEGLAQAGPMNEVPAALCFYRALRVYPSPVELIMIYQKTVPAPIFALLMELTSLDVAGHPGSAAGGAAGPQTGSLANIDDEDDEAAALEASTAPATTGSSEDSSPSGDREARSTASGEWEDVEERS